MGTRPQVTSKDSNQPRGGGLTEMHLHTSAPPKLPSVARRTSQASKKSPRQAASSPKRSAPSPRRGSAPKAPPKATANSSAILATIGVLLLFAGFGWGTYSFVQAHPYVVLVIAGLVCLVLSAGTNHGGLARFLPRGAQHLLFERTPFDIIIDDAGIQRQVRRWVRILMLVGAKSEQDVDSIIGGLGDGSDDPEFLERVLRRGVVHSLPTGLKNLLLPKDGTALAQTPSVTTLMPAASKLGSREINAILRQKAAEKKSVAEQPGFPPPLGPVVQSLAVSASAQGVCQLNYTARTLVYRAMQTTFAFCAAATLMSGAAVVFFRTQMSRRMLDTIAVSGGTMLQRLSDRPALAASCFTAQNLVNVSALGAGGSLILALQLRLRWIPRASSSVAAAAAPLSVVEGRRIGCEPDPEHPPEILSS